jgi:hypothetical protein
MIRVVAAVVAVVLSAAAPVSAIGNPQAAMDFQQWYDEKFGPETFTLPGSSITDFELACEDGKNASQVALNLFGEEHGPYASCECYSSKTYIECSYGDPMRYDANGEESYYVAYANYTVQEWYSWTFDRESGQFKTLDRCFWCHDGDCVDNTTVYDSNCGLLGFYGSQEPTGCAVYFSSSKEYCQDCQVCTTKNGYYGYAPNSDDGCFEIGDLTCNSDPILYNAFIALRAAKQTPYSKFAAIAGSAVSTILFFVIGGSIFYFLLTGHCPRLPCKKCPKISCPKLSCPKLPCKGKKDKEANLDKRAETFSEPEETDNTQTDHPNP